MIAFCIQAFLVIVFLKAHAFTPSRRNRAPLNRGEKFSDAVRAVLPTFYGSSVLLSLGIIAASLKTSVDASGGGQAEQFESWRKGESSYSVYDMQLAVIASYLSVLPTCMAGIMLRQFSRRRRLLINLILPFLVILLLPFIIIQGTWDSNLGDNSAGFVVYFPLDYTLVIQVYTWTVSISVVLVPLIGLIVLHCSLKKSGLTQMPSLHSTWMRKFMGLLQVVLLALMIGGLIIFFFIRAKIIAAGDNSQLEWSFGQVLALTTWIPVAVDFVYTMCCKFHTPGLTQLDYMD